MLRALLFQSWRCEQQNEVAILYVEYEPGTKSSTS